MVLLSDVIVISVLQITKLTLIIFSEPFFQEEELKGAVVLIFANKQVRI